MNTKAQPVTAKRNTASANKLLPLALPFLSVDLKGISAMFSEDFFNHTSFFLSHDNELVTCKKH